MNSNRRKLILVALVVGVVSVALIIIFLPKNNADNTVTKTQVPQGTVVTPNNSSSNGQGTSNNSNQGNQSGGNTTTPTNQQFYDLITQTNSIAPGSDGQVHFGITGVKNPLPGWYIVTISVAGTESNKVIFQETGVANSPLTIVAGPGTDFPPEIIHIPDVVRNAL